MRDKMNPDRLINVSLLNKKLVIVFILLMTVSVYLLYRGYSDVKDSHIRAKTLIEELQTKRDYVTTMHSSARERSLILLRMMGEEDPFELDELNQQMGANARAFIMARQHLTSMHLSEAERSILSEQNALTVINAPLQNQVAELFIEGEHDQAKNLLLNSAIPGQNAILQKINDFILMHENNTGQAVARIDVNFEHASKNFQILGAVLLGISAIFILFTLHISRREQKRLQKMLSEQKKISDQLDQTAEKLSYQASHDALTGLISRREFENRILQLLHRAEEGETHVVFYLDLDQFKIVNDTCGHYAGDELLREVSIVMQSCVRKSDALARLGGDEFGILLEYCDLDFAEKVAQSIIDKINDFRFRWERKTFRVGMSIGMVLMDDNTNNLEDVLKQIDSACYAAKDSGRNRYQIYHEDDKELTQREAEMDWVVRLERALEQNQFILYAQPIVPTIYDKSSQINYEVLIRLKQEDGEIIQPGAFLPSAERYHKMVSIDRWVVNEVLSILSGNQQVLSDIGYFSINLSCQSLTDPGFLKFIVDQLALHSELAEKICLEITETAAINSMLKAVRSISMLRGMGVRFALDDFGSGLSSFGYLKTLPIDYLKIDGMFVRDMLVDPIDGAMVKAIHDIGSLMGKETVAEFVENEDIVNELRNIGVHFVQGYGIGTPLPLEQVIEKQIRNEFSGHITVQTIN
ncbi:MAG: EAL domain-containing protein [Gammaproteobacteria bacterium]|nr:MAG: EAL domain-containing protein [Gammaproteobacteria bacterium]